MEKSFHNYAAEYQRQLKKGDIQKAYQGLMHFMMDLRTHFINKYPNGFVTGGLYQGYMDMTYFPFTPIALKHRKVKFGVVFDHKALQFSVCLLGQNKEVMREVWEKVKGKTWPKYVVPVSPQDAALEYLIVEAPNFDDLEGLTKQIEKGVLAFIRDVGEVIEF